ncbi:hypothetical protein DWG93_24575 [Escherichia coli]|nr:hypothetical protein [Escherichia coli]
MIWQPEFTDKTLSRKTGAVQWLSVCAKRLITGYKPRGESSCIHLAKSNRCYLNQFPRYKRLSSGASAHGTPFCSGNAGISFNGEQ